MRTLFKSVASPLIARFLISANFFLLLPFLGGATSVDSCFVYKGNKADCLDSIAHSSNYETIRSGFPNLGVTEEWQYLKFYVDQTIQKDISYCKIDNSSIDEVLLYSLGEKPHLIGKQGCSTLIKEELKHVNGYLFDLKADSETSGWYLIQARSGKQLIIPIVVGKREDFVQIDNSRNNLMFLYFGMMALLIIYNLFLYLSTSESLYSSYSVYVASVALTQAALFGFGNRYLWSSNEWMSANAIYLFGALSGIFTILFSQKFLKTKLYSPKIHKILWVYVGLDGLSIVLVLLNKPNLSYNLINFNAISSIILLIACYIAIRKGNSSARYFLIAWTMFIASVIVFALKDFGILPYNEYTTFAMPFGSALEGILLSFALANKINLLKQEKEASQHRVIEVMRENQSIIEHQNEQLEQRVHERTSELEYTNNELNLALRNLRLAQAQLLQAEKLSALGQMTAGIAHELNNPINFVSSNIIPLRRDVQDIMHILDDFSSLNGGNDVHEKIAAIRSKPQYGQINDIKREIDVLLNGISEGSRRTTEIVKGLRVFSRSDQDTLVQGNINDCIASALVVLKSMIKGSVTIHKQISDTVPDSNCYPGKLAQLFMNILTNAVQATREVGNSQEDRHVYITSDAADGQIVVSIRDNGPGMSEETRRKMFEPFFTTKAVGEGTGLGLSIAVGIVAEHKGSIEVDSQPGQGTTFVITLPTNLV